MCLGRGMNYVHVCRKGYECVHVCSVCGMSVHVYTKGCVYMCVGGRVVRCVHV